MTRNEIRCFVYGLSAKLAPSPVNGSVAVYYQRLARFSAAFAYLADVALLVLGGALKRKEKLSGRFADALSYMYLASASLKHFKDQGQRQEDRPLLDWSCQYCLYQVQSALDEILRNFPISWLGIALRIAIFPVGRRLRLPDDELSHQVASLLIEDNDSRDRLTQGIYISTDPQDVTGRIEDALAKVIAAEPIERRLRKDRVAQPVGSEPDINNT